MGRVAVVVVLEGPDAVTERQTREGAVLAVWRALKLGGVLPDSGGIVLPVEYINGEKAEYEVFGVDDVNIMIRERALSVDVTGRLFGEKGTGE